MSTNEIPSQTQNEEEISKKRKRSKSKLNYNNIENARLAGIKVDEYRFPMTKHGGRYGSTNGILVWDTIPITHKSWHDVPDEAKDLLWQIIKVC